MRAGARARRQPRRGAWEGCTFKFAINRRLLGHLIQRSPLGCFADLVGADFLASPTTRLEGDVAQPPVHAAARRCLIQSHAF